MLETQLSYFFQSLLTWLCHIRLVELSPRLEESTRGWGTTVHVDTINIDWFVPGVQELEIVKGLLTRYLTPLVESLDRFIYILFFLYFNFSE